MKKIMMLGGNYFQMTATLAAKQLGYHVISVDYLPDNPAHKYADEYYNISTVDKEAVLKKAQELCIDGIVSYGSDVSAPTAAYVAEALGLPTNPYDSVELLTHKDKFRSFLRTHHFPVPEGKSFDRYEEAASFFSAIRKPVIVKPVDSSGSKGVNTVNTVTELRSAWEEAMHYSLSGRVILEEFIEKQGYQMDGDIFVIDGRIRFWGVCNQHHDFLCSPYAPAGLSFPSVQPVSYQEKAKAQIQRLLELLHMHMGAYNVEYLVGTDGEIYLLEIGPRNGGNLIPDILKVSTGVDLASYTVRQAVGEDCSDLCQQPAHTCAASCILHSDSDGTFRSFWVSPEIQNQILRMDVLVTDGTAVSRFRNGGFGIGAAILRFDDTKQMCRQMDHMKEYMHPIVDPVKEVNPDE